MYAGICKQGILYLMLSNLKSVKLWQPKLDAYKYSKTNKLVRQVKIEYFLFFFAKIEHGHVKQVFSHECKKKNCVATCFIFFLFVLLHELLTHNYVHDPHKIYIFITF